MDQGCLLICLFGSHLFRVDGRPYNLGFRGTTLNLLQYLVVNAGREIRREFIADQFWRQSSEYRQRSALNSAIWRISKKLPDHPGISLNVTDTTICFEIDDDIPVDTHRLIELVHRGTSCEVLSHQLADELSAALDASEAPFIDGAVEDWVLSEKERLFNIRLPYRASAFLRPRVARNLSGGF